MLTTRQDYEEAIKCWKETGNWGRIRRRDDEIIAGKVADKIAGFRLLLNTVKDHLGTNFGMECRCDGKWSRDGKWKCTACKLRDAVRCIEEPLPEKRKETKPVFGLPLSQKEIEAFDEFDFDDLEEELEWREGNVKAFNDPKWTFFHPFNVEKEKKRILEILEIFASKKHTRKVCANQDT